MMKRKNNKHNNKILT